MTLFLAVCHINLEQDGEARKDTSSYHSEPVDLAKIDYDTACARRAIAAATTAA